MLERFAGYKSRSEPSSGEAGAKHAYADRIIFLPQAEPSVRRDGLITGAVDVAASLPFDFYDALKSNPDVEPVGRQEYAFADDRLQHQGRPGGERESAPARSTTRSTWTRSCSPPSAIRTSIRSIRAGFPIRRACFTPRSEAEGFGKPDVALAKKLLADSGYHGEKLRWLTSKDFYQEHYLPALTAQQQLADIGINTDLEVMPAATYIQTRSDPGKFDMFSSFLPTYVDPVVIPYLNKTYPGFWADPKKEELVKKLAATTDLKERQAIWEDIQKLIYDQMPYLKYGVESALLRPA